MERYNHRDTEKKWQNRWDSLQIFRATVDQKKKNTMCWKCFLTHREKFIWVMYATTQWVML